MGESSKLQHIKRRSNNTPRGALLALKSCIRYLIVLEGKLGLVWVAQDKCNSTLEIRCEWVCVGLGLMPKFTRLSIEALEANA